MKIREMWDEMSREDVTTKRTWLTRGAEPSPQNRLVVAWSPDHQQPALLVPAKAPKLAASTVPSCRGLDIWIRPLGSGNHLGVVLLDKQFLDVFELFAEDVKERLKVASPRVDPAEIVIARLRKWQKFLTAEREELGRERQLGLVGELVVLANIVLPHSEPAKAIQAWVGPNSAHQDFQIDDVAIEVKTSIAKNVTTVRISSERQLDPLGAERMYLTVVALDARPTPTNAENGREVTEIGTLPALVARLRQSLDGHPLAASAFDDRLLDARYHDAHAERYADVTYALRSLRCFAVRDDFPSLVPNVLPSGVGNVQYDLELAACIAFEVGDARAILVADRG